MYNTILYQKPTEKTEEEDREQTREIYFSSVKLHSLTKIVQFSFENDLTIWMTELFYYIGDQCRYSDSDSVNELNAIHNASPSTFEEFRLLCFHILNLANYREPRKDVSRLLKSTPFSFLGRAEHVFFVITLCLAVKFFARREVVTRTVCSLESEKHLLFSAILSSYENSLNRVFQKEGLSGLSVSMTYKK